MRISYTADHGRAAGHSWFVKKLFNVDVYQEPSIKE